MYLILYSTSNRPRTDLVGEKPCIENIDTINQPSATYAYPKREQSGGMRSFQSKWFAEFRWLHYDPETDSALCFTCVQAYKQNKMTLSKDEPAFFKNGYRNWNNGPANFREYAKSNTLLQSCDKLAKPSTSQGTWTKFLTPFQSRRDIITDRCY